MPTIFDCIDIYFVQYKKYFKLPELCRKVPGTRSLLRFSHSYLRTILWGEPLCQRREEQSQARVDACQPHREWWCWAQCWLRHESPCPCLRAYGFACLWKCQSGWVSSLAKAYSDLAKFASVGLSDSLPISRRPSHLPNFPERLGFKAPKLSCILLLLFWTC